LPPRGKVVQGIGAFALYGFPESRTISFALLAYSCGRLKVHHAAEFYTGLLNNQPMSFYSPNSLIQDGKRRGGLRFLPVSVAHSAPQTTVGDDRHVNRRRAEPLTSPLRLPREAAPLPQGADFWFLD
jgi:error-prone DNA polymerase